LRRFAKDRSAATAVEFALVGAPFFVMLMGLVEVTTSYFASVQLENGMETVARQIRTGEITAANMTAAQFQNLLCAQTAPLIPCNANLYVDVRTFDDFGNVQNIPPLNPDGTINAAFQFNPGTAGSIVLARAFYVWHITTPVLGSLLENMAGNDRLLQASAIFRNEPFPVPGP
jgi:Flp pilus assembly protein TadG